MNRIAITLPISWIELTDGQLYYLFNLFQDNLSADQIKTYCFFLWGKIRVVCRYGEHDFVVKHNSDTFRVSRELIASAIHELDWIDSMPEYPVRISRIGRYIALPADFQGVELEKYIYCDNLYQGYLSTQKQDLLNEMASILYNAPKIKTNAAEKLSTFYWFASLKELLARTFPHFLQPAASVSSENLLEQGAPLGQRLQEAMNAQIRALTKGDITKEKQVLSMDTWRALAELDAQAKEYEELKRQYGK